MLHAFRCALAVALLCCLAALPVAAAELTVVSFIDLTIDRLELASTTWSEERRSPTEAEEDDLFEHYGTLAEHYLAFASERRLEIESYLDNEPLKRNRIEALSRQISELIEQEEVQ